MIIRIVGSSNLNFSSKRAMLKIVAPKCGYTVASDFIIVGSVVGGAVSLRQQGLVIASPVELS